MKVTTAVAAAIILGCIASPSPAERPPLTDPATLNIGLACRWDMRCMTIQRNAMTSALTYVRNKRPPAWRVHLCNRNAARAYNRVDWVGFDHCIRNRSLRPGRPRARR